MIVYPPYSGDQARCEKCGATDASTEYHNLLESHVLFVAGVEPGPEEWLLRTCRCCRYTWPEACIAPIRKKRP